MGFLPDISIAGLVGLPTSLKGIPGTVSDLTGGERTKENAIQNPNVQNFDQNAQFQQAQQGLNGQLGQQAALQQALMSQNGIGNQSSVFAQQQALANQLQAQASGQAGPSLAQLNLANNTGQNVAMQNALMAGQRGASANPALLARQAAQQGSGIQQQSAGQAAVLQAQQQLQAQQALQAQQHAMAGLATNQVGQQIGNQQYLTGNHAGNQQAILGAIGNQNATQAGIQNTQQQGQNQLNAGVQNFIPGLFSGAASGAGSAAMMMSSGGQVPSVQTHPNLPAHLRTVANLYHGHGVAPLPKFAMGGEMTSMNVGGDLKEGGKVPGKAKMKGDHPENDVVSASLSPGEVVIPKSIMESDDPVKGAAAFIAAIQKKKGNDPKKDFHDALNRAISGRKKK